MSVLNSVIEILAEFNSVQRISISKTTNLSELGFDSLDLLDFQMRIEQIYGFDLPIADIMNCNNVENLCKLIEFYGLKKDP